MTKVLAEKLNGKVLKHKRFKGLLFYNFFRNCFAFPVCCMCGVSLFQSTTPQYAVDLYPWTQVTVEPSLILGQISLAITEPSYAN